MTMLCKMQTYLASLKRAGGRIALRPGGTLTRVGRHSTLSSPKNLGLGAMLG
jgi:hypothetical protein